MTLRRRSFVQSIGAAAVAAAVPGAARAAVSSPPASGSNDKAFYALLDRISNDRISRSPEMATSLGLDTGERAGLKAQLSGRTVQDDARDLAHSQQELRAINDFASDTLGSAAQLDQLILRYQLERKIAAAETFKYGSTGGYFAPYRLSQLGGAYRELPDFLDTRHRIATAEDADAYLSRLRRFAKVVDEETVRQAEDATYGVYAPDYVIDTLLKQMEKFRDRQPADSGLVTGFAKKLAAAGLPDAQVAQAEMIVAAEIDPAIDRQRDLMKRLRRSATHDAGVWRLPDGEAYYAAAVEAATTVKMTGDEIHAAGLEQVAEISSRIDAILKTQDMTEGTVGERLVALNQRPDQLFPNDDAGREQLLAYLNTQIEELAPRLSEQFSTLPKAPVEVRRVPPNIQDGAPGGYYQAATLDGSRPGIYYINLRDTFDRPKFGLATLTYHEASPGHHLQVMLALESSDIPMIRRRGMFSGYSEGWALYAEQLADEMGMYAKNPLGQVGYLQSLLFRATRLVVDSGMHVKRWSREQATDYFIATTGIARGRSQGEIDRYTVWPGQACSYKIGHNVWAQLRDEARAKAGENWDPRKFHDVLKLGSMPLEILQRVVRGLA